MRKYLVLTVFLSLALFVCAQNPLEELAFYQKQAQSGEKQTQKELVNNLQNWLEENASLPQAGKALILKANLQRELKAYPESLITLLRYKYEFGTSDKTNVQSVLKDSVSDFPKSEQEKYNNLVKNRVPNTELPQRLDTFLTLATKANIKGTYQPLIQEYNSFFKRFKDYEGLDRLELMLGDLHRANKNPYGALMQYQKVWDIYPNTKYKVASLRMQGDVYASDIKDYEKAKDIYEKVLNDYPTSVERATAYYHLAVLEETQKQYNEAIEHLNFASELYKAQGDNASLYDTLMFKAEIQEKKLKDYEGAAQTLNKTASLFKNNEEQFKEVQFKLADLYHHKIKDSSLERKAYEDFVRAYPNSKYSEKAVFEVASLAKKAGEYEFARNYLEKFIVNNPASEYAPAAQRQLNSLNKKLAKNK